MNTRQPNRRQAITDLLTQNKPELLKAVFHPNRERKEQIPLFKSKVLIKIAKMESKETIPLISAILEDIQKTYDTTADSVKQIQYCLKIFEQANKMQNMPMTDILSFLGNAAQIKQDLNGLVTACQNIEINSLNIVLYKELVIFFEGFYLNSYQDKDALFDMEDKALSYATNGELTKMIIADYYERATIAVEKLIKNYEEVKEATKNIDQKIEPIIEPIIEPKVENNSEKDFGKLLLEAAKGSDQNKIMSLSNAIQQYHLTENQKIRLLYLREESIASLDRYKSDTKLKWILGATVSGYVFPKTHGPLVKNYVNKIKFSQNGEEILNILFELRSASIKSVSDGIPDITAKLLLNAYQMLLNMYTVSLKGSSPTLFKPASDVISLTSSDEVMPTNVVNLNKI